MNLRPGSLPRFFGVPFLQLRVLGILADDGVLHYGVAEVVHHRRDGEDTTQPFVPTFLRYGLLGLSVRVIRSRQYSHRGGGQRQPCDHASSCGRSRTACVIITSLVMAVGLVRLTTLSDNGPI
jgi:hypothetical protein